MEHAATILKTPRAELVALCDSAAPPLRHGLEEVGKWTGGARPAPRGFGDYRQMLEWGEFDAVFIATPIGVHKDMSIQAIRAGKHVLLEKPLTPTLEEGRAIRAAYRGAKTVLQVGYEVRSSQLVHKILEMRREGKLGDIVFVWWHMFMRHDPQGWRAERKNMGGKLFDCCCHYWDVLQLLAGARFHRLSAFGSRKGEIGPNADTLPQIATINFEYENGAKGNLSMSEVTPTPEDSLFGVVGTRGIIYGNPWRPEGAGSMDCYIEDGMYRQQIVINGKLASRGHLGFAEQVCAFVAAILDGGPVPCTLDDAFEVAVTAAAIDRSIATGQTVTRAEVTGE
jgi:myo-inositol 2-dehydrogenase/D-chiro-inositol 1-dehydrogenase